MFNYGWTEIIAFFLLIVACWILYSYFRSQYSKDKMKDKAKEMGEKVKEAGEDFKEITSGFTEGISDVKKAAGKKE